MAISVTTLDFCSEPVDLYCPVCGEQIFACGVQQNTCRHTIFLGDSAAGIWSWQQRQYTQEFDTALQKKYADACKNGFCDDFSNYTKTIRADVAATLAAETIMRKSAFMLSVSTSDIGCGGMHNGTIHVIFDYLPTAPKLISLPGASGQNQ